MTTIDRATYASMYGPTTGDRVRLADTSLWLEIEKDYTVYGDECVFGGGKVIRDGMGQHPLATRAEGALDLVITNAIIVDTWGIVKADIGIKDGYISGIGKAGNPLMMDGVTDGMIIGVGTEVISGENLIVTAGGVDSHVHFISPQQVEIALQSGVTTFVGGGTGPATGTLATNCTSGYGTCSECCKRPMHCRSIWFSGTRKQQSSGSAGRTSPCRGGRTQNPRRLGQHALRHRQMPERC